MTKKLLVLYARGSFAQEPRFWRSYASQKEADGDFNSMKDKTIQRPCMFWLDNENEKIELEHTSFRIDGK